MVANGNRGYPRDAVLHTDMPSDMNHGVVLRGASME